jgi:uncharacterized repeat protein (TIGR02543 family)
MRKILRPLFTILFVVAGVISAPTANATVLSAPTLVATYATGGPALSGMADTGTQIWGTDFSNNQVVVINKADGSIAQTIDLPSGANPREMCVTSNYVYTTNQGLTSLTKIDRTTYAATQIALTGRTTDLVCSDTYIWASSYIGSKVFQISATTDAVLATITLSTASNMGTDGTNLYVMYSNAAKLAKFDFATATSVFSNVSLTMPPSATGLNDILASGDYLWIASNSGYIMKLNASDGSSVSVTSTLSSNAYKLIIYGDAMIVGNGGGVTSYVYDISSGTPVYDADIPSQGSMAQFDGTYIWMAGSYSTSVKKIGAAYILAAPNAPGTPTATAGNGAADVSWTAPVGGEAPSSYTVTSSPGGLTCTATAPATTCNVAGLTNGTAYTFSVVATNSGGNSSPTSASNSVTPVAVVSGAPGTPTATAGDGSATVSWTAPSSGGAPVSYTVTSSPGGLTCTVNAPATSCEVEGLNNGTAYTFTVVATNTGGNSSPSSASNSVSPVITVSGAPGTPTAVAGDGEAEVSWTAPSSGGAPDSYTVTSSPGGLTCEVNAPATSCVVDGLNNGTAYTFTVVATNDGGDSSPSSASTSVTPVQSQADEYEVTITKSGKGSFSNGSATVEDGDTFTSTATPKKGYKFKGWTCEPDSLDTTAKTISFTVTEDVSCVATFKKKSPVVNPTDSDLKVVFELDGWKLGNVQATMLSKQVASFKAGGFSTITITGYTDSLGSVKNNANLSLARAKAVRNFMKQYLPKAKFVVVAGGSSNPVASNATEEGRAQNRRAEISFS